VALAVVEVAVAEAVAEVISVAQVAVAVKKQGQFLLQYSEEHNCEGE
jgi:hypothetical protein